MTDESGSSVSHRELQRSSSIRECSLNFSTASSPSIGCNFLIVASLAPWQCPLSGPRPTYTSTFIMLRAASKLPRVGRTIEVSAKFSLGNDLSLSSEATSQDGLHVEKLVGTRTESQRKTGQRRHAGEGATKEEQNDETRRSPYRRGTEGGARGGGKCRPVWADHVNVVRRASSSPTDTSQNGTRGITAE